MCGLSLTADILFSPSAMESIVIPKIALIIRSPTAATVNWSKSLRSILFPCIFLSSYEVVQGRDKTGYSPENRLPCVAENKKVKIDHDKHAYYGHKHFGRQPEH